MGDATLSPGDPVFYRKCFLLMLLTSSSRVFFSYVGNVVFWPLTPSIVVHHGWLDKLWWEWQKRDLPNRYTDMGGPNLPIGGKKLSRAHFSSLYLAALSYLDSLGHAYCI